MRRSLSAALIRFASVALAIAVSAHVAAHTVFSPERAGRVVAAVLATDQGRDQVAAMLTASVPAPQRPTVRAKVRAELDSAKVRRAVADAVTPGAGTALPTGQIRDVMVEQMAATHPAAAKSLAKAPVRDVPVPAAVTARVSAGHDRSLAVRNLAALAAAALAAAAVVVARRRAWVCTTLGRRAGGACLSLLALFWVAPWVLGQLSSGWAVTAAVGLRAGGSDMVPWTLAVASAAAALLTAGWAVGALAPVASPRQVPAASRRRLKQMTTPPPPRPSAAGPGAAAMGQPGGPPAARPGRDDLWAQGWPQDGVPAGDELGIRERGPGRG